MISDVKELMDDKLKEFFDSLPKQKNEFIQFCYDLLKAYTLSSGKRLRPLAAILAYESCGGKNNEEIQQVAIALELHHTYSLILDDLMDEDNMRRNHLTIHESLLVYYDKHFKEGTAGHLFHKQSSRFASSFAIMLGNVMSILSRKSLFGVKKEKTILQLQNLTDENIYRGQMLDLLAEHTSLTEKDYYELIEKKTGVLFGLSLQLGAMVAGKNAETQRVLFNIGVELAIAFQIQDDLLDLTANKGRPIGSDITHHKKTLLYIKAKEKYPELEELYKKELTSDEVKAIIEKLESSGATEYCKKKIQSIESSSTYTLKKLNLVELVKFPKKILHEN